MWGYLIGTTLIGGLALYNWTLLKMGLAVVRGSYKNLTNTTSTLDICSSSKAARIKVNRNGKDYELFVPYNRALLSRTTGKKIVAVMRDGTRVHIDHPPGVPFLITPAQIGAESIDVENEIDHSAPVTKFVDSNLVTL